jgi:hypothetical protein
MPGPRVSLIDTDEVRGSDTVPGWTVSEIEKALRASYKESQQQHSFADKLQGLTLLCWPHPSGPEPEDSTSKHNITVGYQFLKIYLQKDRDYRNSLSNFYGLFHIYLEKVNPGATNQQVLCGGGWLFEKVPNYILEYRREIHLEQGEMDWARRKILTGADNYYKEGLIPRWSQCL